MPKAARDFVLGNRMVSKGEDFEIPAGEESVFEGYGLVEGVEPAPDEATAAQPASSIAGAETPALGDAAGASAPGAHETAEEAMAREAGATRTAKPEKVEKPDRK